MPGFDLSKRAGSDNQSAEDAIKEVREDWE